MTIIEYVDFQLTIKFVAQIWVQHIGDTERCFIFYTKYDEAVLNKINKAD